MNFQLKSPWNGTHLHQTPGWLTQYSSLIQVQNTISVIDLVTCIDVQLIFDNVRLGLSSAANILQVADVALRVVLLLFLPCFFLLLFRIVPAAVLALETSEMCAICFFTTKTTQPRLQVFSVTVPYPVAGYIFDVVSSLNTKFFQIWSSVTGYGELCVCF